MIAEMGARCWWWSMREGRRLSGPSWLSPGAVLSQQGEVQDRCADGEVWQADLRYGMGGPPFG